MRPLGSAKRVGQPGLRADPQFQRVRHRHRHAWPRQRERLRRVKY
jgi:hypothetical protein